MTVCVAARSLRNECIVGACDMMLSRSDDSIPATDDATVKVLTLSSRWGVMYAGSPTHALDIVSRAQTVLQTQPRSPNTEESMAEMRRVMKNAYQEELRRQIEDNILTRYGMTILEFRRVGRRQLGDAEFAITNKALREFSLRSSLIVCGVDRQNFPHMFTVHSPNGAIVVNDAGGSAAIGTGAQMALGSLGSRNINILDVRNLVFRVCEAKFDAETAHGVGKSTLLTVWRRGFSHTIWGHQTEELREISKRLRAQPAPDDALESIERSFGSTGVFQGLRPLGS